MNLDTIHEILAQLDLAAQDLDNYKAKTLEIEDMPGMAYAVNAALGWDSTAYTDMPARLGVNVALLSKFTKFKGTIQTSAARKVVDRLRSYVRSLDQATPPPAVMPEQEPPKPRVADRLRFRGEQWAMVQLTSDMKLKIAAVSSLLDSIIVQVQRSNAPMEEQILTEIERTQLIAILETVLVVLKSPVVEKGLLKKARDVLGKASESAAEKQVESGIGEMASAAGRIIAELIKGMFSV